MATMTNHKTVLGALFIALGIMGTIGMLVVLLIFGFGTGILGVVATQDPELPTPVVFLPAIFGTVILFFIGISTIPCLIAGFGLLAERTWGRMAALIAGVVSLPSIPIGTGVGIYAIWYFLQDHRVGNP